MESSCKQFRIYTTADISKFFQISFVVKILNCIVMYFESWCMNKSLKLSGSINGEEETISVPDSFLCDMRTYKRHSSPARTAVCRSPLHPTKKYANTLSEGLSDTLKNLCIALYCITLI